MKKILLLLVGALCCQISLAQTPPPPPPPPTPTSITIVLTSKPGQGKGGRSAMVKPRVWFSYSLGTPQIEVMLRSDDDYSIEVVNQSGATIYSSSVGTDGGRNIYMLPDLDDGLYSIYIDGPAVTYEGEFFVY